MEATELEANLWQALRLIQSLQIENRALHLALVRSGKLDEADILQARAEAQAAMDATQTLQASPSSQTLEGFLSAISKFVRP
jgi:hypothetical protein